MNYIAELWGANIVPNQSLIVGADGMFRAPVEFPAGARLAVYEADDNGTRQPVITFTSRIAQHLTGVALDDDGRPVSVRGVESHGAGVRDIPPPAEAPAGRTTLAAFPTGPELAQLAFEQMRAKYAAAPVGSLSITELALIAIAGSLVGAPVLALPGADMMAGLDVVPHEPPAYGPYTWLDGGGVDVPLNPVSDTAPDEGPACTCMSRRTGDPPCPRAEYIWGPHAEMTPSPTREQADRREP